MLKCAPFLPLLGPPRVLGRWLPPAHGRVTLKKASKARESSAFSDSTFVFESILESQHTWYSIIPRPMMWRCGLTRQPATPPGPGSDQDNYRVSPPKSANTDAPRTSTHWRLRAPSRGVLSSVCAMPLGLTKRSIQCRSLPHRQNPPLRLEFWRRAPFSSTIHAAGVAHKSVHGCIFRSEGGRDGQRAIGIQLDGVQH